jgi:hypothetical protein
MGRKRGGLLREAAPGCERVRNSLVVRSLAGGRLPAHDRSQEAIRHATSPNPLPNAASGASQHAYPTMKGGAMQVFSRDDGP